MESEIDLVYKNGKFTDESDTIIKNIDSKNIGFRNLIEKLSKNFYGFNVSSTDEEIDYSTRLTNVKELIVDVRIINTPIFSYQKEIDKDKRLINLLENLKKYHQLKGDTNMANLVKFYISKRSELKNNYINKYANIKSNGNIKISDFLLISKDNELSFKIGNEFNIKSLVFYTSKIYKETKDQYKLPISVYDPNPKKELIDGENPFSLPKATIDTGCTTTTFSLKILEQLKKLYPAYADTITGPFFSNMANNTKEETWEEFLDLNVCDYKYENVNVHFMNLSVDCLVGTDLINTGIFTSYFGKQIIFQPVPRSTNIKIREP